jgi:hypothetical protein
MRTLLTLALALWGLGGQPRLHAQDRDMALAVIERGIKASGGEEGLRRALIANRNGKGVAIQMGKTIPFTTEITQRLPDRMRLAIELETKFRVATVVNGSQGWELSGGSVRDLTTMRLQELREEIYVWWLSSLLPVRGADFTLAMLPETKVNERPTAGVLVSHKDHKDVKLYFDKSTSLLVKVERRGPEGGLPVDKEYFYSDYKEFDGVQLPTRELVLINGKKSTEVTYTRYRFMARPDEEAFKRP